MAERLTSALVGAVIGGAIGFALAWLLGIYSNTLGPGLVPMSFSRAAMAGAALCGGIGLVFGPSVGTLLGHVISGMFAFERDDGRGLPLWPVLVALLAVAGVVVWAARSTT